MTTETGAGQWGSALSMACKFFDMDLEVYMVKVSYDQKPYRRFLMETYGAQVFASPTDRTHSGRAILAQDPNSPGSLGIAISEAVEVAATSGGTKKYSLGSVLNHVLLHQTVIGEEASSRWIWPVNTRMWSSAAWAAARISPGLPIPFLRENLRERAANPPAGGRTDSHPSLTRGFTPSITAIPPRWRRSSRCTPSGTISSRPPSTPAGCAITAWRPRFCALYDAGLIEAVAVPQLTHLRSGGAVRPAPRASCPRPRSAHAIRAAIDEALEGKEKGEKKVILFNLSGHGHFDLTSYNKYNTGQLEDYDYPEEAIATIRERLPQVSF